MFNSLRSKGDGAATAVAGASTETIARPAAAKGMAPIAPGRDEPEMALPSEAQLVDEWRTDVARTTIALGERYPTQDATRGHAERLLVKLAVDLDVTIRQPPVAAREALAVIADPDSDLHALVRALERDPTLCQALMRQAGSALFGTCAAPGSIDDAVRRLGAKGVQVAVLAGMAESLLERATGPYHAPAQQLWGALTRSGPRARAMARAFDVPAQEAFLLGLLHDVGQLVLLDLMSALRDEVRRDIVLPEGMGEDVLHMLHEPLGALTLVRWGVDVRGTWAVAHHHRTGELPPGRDARSELLYIGEQLETALQLGRPLDVAAWCEEGRLCTAPVRVEAAVAAAVETAAAA